MRKRKAPAGCYWRGNTIWGRVKVRGRLIRWSLNTDDPAVAKARRQAGKDRAVADAFHGDARRSFEEAFAAWDAQLLRAVGAKTATRYLCSLKQLAPWLDGRALSDINGRLVAEIIRERQKAGVTNATIKRDLGALSSVLNYCILQGWIEANPVLAKLALVPERRDPILLPTDRDIALVLERAPGMVGQMMRAALVTGAREDELARAGRIDIDHTHRQLTVIGKRNKLRVIDLVPFDGYQFFKALPAYVGKPWLFWHDDGEPYASFAPTFHKLIDRTEAWAAANGVEFRRFAFHHLRHRHAVDWLKSGRDIYTLQGRLEHTSVKTTEIYLDYLTPQEVQVAKFGVAAKGDKQSARMTT
jgi:integrase/recombinase XerD